MRDTCVGCNMCSLVCPVDGCITDVQDDAGLSPMSWNQYQARLARGEIDPIGRRGMREAHCAGSSRLSERRQISASSSTAESAIRNPSRAVAAATPAFTDDTTFTRH